MDPSSSTSDPRVARTREAVRDAVRRLVREAGLEAVTHQRVAAEAGVGRATVYRHWPDRTHLLLDALAELGIPEGEGSSGDLVADLTRELGRLQRILSGSPLVPELVALIGRAEWQPELREVKASLLASGTAGLRRSLVAGIDRGDIPSDLDLDTALAQLAGPLFYRRLLAHGAIEDRLVEDVVASFVNGVAAR
jgi:AcrR family transcriptional regulator